MKYCQAQRSVQITFQRLSIPLSKQQKCFQSSNLKRYAILDFGMFDFNKQKTNDQRIELKSQIVDLCQQLDKGYNKDEDLTDELQNLVKQLERLNPTKKTITSPLLNGRWKLRYSSSDAILRTKSVIILRPFDIFQTLDIETLQAENQTRGIFPIQGRASLTPKTDDRVQVQFNYFKYFNLIKKDADPRIKGFFDVTYLDEEMRVSRSNLDNLFVLTMDDSSKSLKD